MKAVAGATLGAVRSTPDIDARLRARLQEAVDLFAAGNVEQFGKRIGYENGGYVRQCLRRDKPRPVRAVLIGRIHDDPEMRGWFDGILPPLVAADVREKRPRIESEWPFRRLTKDQWDSLGALQAVVEDVAVTKARELLREIAVVEPESSKHLRRKA